jgi:enoyl-[acyl-carrier protein] reductase/trans-2-enoyl-CoA reductase (NAD+)
MVLHHEDRRRIEKMEPKSRGGICMNAHPAGCAEETRLQIEYIEKKLTSEHPATGPRRVLVIGSSTGYGLASRITAAFGYGAATVGVSFEREPSEKRSGTPGWYNTRTFDQEAEKRGIPSRSFNGDAFSDEMREKVAAALKELGGPADLVIYSLASGLRTDPSDGTVYRSTLKPLGNTYRAKSVDFMTGKVDEVEIKPAGEEEKLATVKVMGGEDWELWINFLRSRDLLAKDAITLAYSYIGPEVTHAVYREGTIGAAKEDLEKRAIEMNRSMSPAGGGAYVSVNKALVTRASAVIPVVPLYIGLLFRVMKEKGIHEGCIEQAERLFRDRLYSGKPVEVDDAGRIRIDDWEMREDVQKEIAELWEKVDENNVEVLADLEGYREDFLRIHGFSVPGVDYSAPVDMQA